MMVTAVMMIVKMLMMLHNSENSDGIIDIIVLLIISISACGINSKIDNKAIREITTSIIIIVITVIKNNLNICNDIGMIIHC